MLFVWQGALSHVGAQKGNVSCYMVSVLGSSAVCNKFPDVHIRPDERNNGIYTAGFAEFTCTPSLLFIPHACVFEIATLVIVHHTQ